MKTIALSEQQQQQHATTTTTTTKDTGRHLEYSWCNKVREWENEHGSDMRRSWKQELRHGQSERLHKRAEEVAENEEDRICGSGRRKVEGNALP